MKKYILIILLIGLCLVLSGCGKQKTKESYLGYEQEHELMYSHYAIIKEYNSGDFTNGDTYLVYDVDTRIMYQIINRGHAGGICEYYIRVNNKPEIAIYGYNYKGE